jgi:hypothetical protein
MANDLRALQAAIAGEPTNQQIDELWDEVASYFHLYDEARELVREALARWGPRAALAEGAGVGVTDEELETLVIAIQALVPIMDDGTHLLEAVDKGRDILRRALHNYGTTHPRPIPVAELRALLSPGYELGDGSMDGAQIVDCEWWHPEMGCDSLQFAVDNCRAIAHPRPIPVAERPWEREGFCDDEHCCWAIGQHDNWMRVYVPGRNWSNPAYTHVLPAAAIPLPEASP